MKVVQGYGIEWYPRGDGPTREWDTFTCNHCQRVIRFEKRKEAHELGGHCLVCDCMICDECVGKGCTPFEEKIREQETRAANRKSYEI